MKIKDFIKTYSDEQQEQMIKDWKTNKNYLNGEHNKCDEYNYIQNCTNFLRESAIKYVSIITRSCEIIDILKAEEEIVFAIYEDFYERCCIKSKEKPLWKD